MANQNVTTHTSRDSWKSKWGFVLACIGSAVGMGNIWLFPSRVAKYGGAFLLAYFIFDILIGFSGVIGEMSFGRATRSGPVGSFEKACASRGKSSLGMKIGLLPMAGALALAIGYSVVVSWIFKYTFGALTGSALSYGSDIGEIGGYASAFESTATTFGNNDWLIFGLIVTFLIMILGLQAVLKKPIKS